MKRLLIGGAVVVVMWAGPVHAAEEVPPEAGRNLVEAAKKAKVRVWGQVNRAFLQADNGTFSESFHVDNDSQPSRLGVSGEYQPPEWPDWTVGGQIELGLKSDNSTEVVFNGPDPEFEVDGRKVEAYARHPRAGSFSMGQGDMASNGTAEEDLSGTYVSSYSQVRFMAASLIFGTNGPAIRDVFNSFDGLHRDDRFRYDTPVWNGWSAAASVAGQEYVDVALRHARALGPHKLAAALAYAQKGTAVDQYDGSCSLLLACGLNLTAAVGGQDVAGDQSPFSYYGKVGWQLDLLSCGLTCVAVDYSRNEEVKQAEDAAESYAVIVNQYVKPISSEVYMTARTYTLDRPGESYDDIMAYMAGVKLSF